MVQWEQLWAARQTDINSSISLWVGHNSKAMCKDKVNHSKQTSNLSMTRTRLINNKLISNSSSSSSNSKQLLSSVVWFASVDLLTLVNMPRTNAKPAIRKSRRCKELVRNTITTRIKVSSSLTIKWHSKTILTKCSTHSIINLITCLMEFLMDLL